MSMPLRRILPALLLVAAAALAFASPGAAKPHGDDANRPNEMSTATPPPFRPNLKVAFGPFHLGATRGELDNISRVDSSSTAQRVKYVVQDGEQVLVTYANDAAVEIHIERALTEKSKAILSTSDGIRLGAPIGAVLPLYGEPDSKEDGNAPGYTLYAWRMQEGRSIVFQTFLGRIVGAAMLPPPSYPSGVSISGGGGASESDPVVVSAPSHALAVEGEYDWLARIDCGAAGMRLAFEKDSASNGKRLEALGLYCADDERIYFFDVTNVPKGS